MFTAKDMAGIVGYQFTLQYDVDKVVFKGMEAGALGLSEQNFGLNRLSQGLITTSFASAEALANTEGALFILVFDVKDEAQVSEVFRINSIVTRAGKL